MKSGMKRLLSRTLCLAIVAGFSFTQAQGAASEGWVPFSSLVVCDEPVLIEGIVHSVSKQTVNKKTSHLNVHLNAHGTGFGFATGTKYIFNLNIREKIKDGNGAYVIKVNHQGGLGGLRVRSTDPAVADFFIDAEFQIVVNAKGETSVVKAEFTAVCE
jgi:hypothetical protein